MNLQSLLILLEGLICLASTATINTHVNRRPGSSSLQLLQDNADDSPLLLPAIPGVRTSLVNTSLTLFDPLCTPVLGEDINPRSCRNAISKIPRSTDSVTIGWRGKGTFDLTMPYIWTSDDGNCSIYVSARGTMRPDIYSFRGFAEDAFQIQQKCVRDPHLRQGGWIGEVGRAKQLCVQIVKTGPAEVECDDNPPPPYTSCRSVLDTMPWDDRVRTFGRGGQIQLPFLLPSFDGQCVFQITSVEAMTATRWSRVFTAIAQIDEICVKNGKSGHAYLADDASENLKVSIAQRHVTSVS